MISFRPILCTLGVLILQSATFIESFSIQPGGSCCSHRSLAMRTTANSPCVTLLMSSTNTDTDAFASLHNFGPASSRDTFLYTAERPGNPPGKKDLVPDEKVYEYIAFMKEQGVARVLLLLDEQEIAIYSDLLAMYTAGGLQYNIQSMNEEGAAKKVMAILKASEEQGERVCTHCTGGIGRCGRVAAAWLVERYNLSPTVATEETLAQASASGVTRNGDATALSEWLGI
jgi:putative intracellular protease/amidase